MLPNPAEFKYFKRRFVSKWVVLILDMMIISFSLFIVYLFQGKRFLHEFDLINYFRGLVSVICFALVGHSLFKPHQGVIRYTSVHDIKRVLFSRTTALLLNQLYIYSFSLAFSFTFFAITPLAAFANYILSCFLLIVFRLSIKYVFNLGKANTKKPSILIYGAGEAGYITLDVLSSSYEVLAFIDDNIKKRGKFYQGIKILHSGDNIDKFAEKNQINLVVISVQNATPKQKREMVDRCIDWGLEVKSVPPIEEWIGGELTKSQIKTIHIEDLLGRDAIKLEGAHIEAKVKGKTILVTGAAGSIGSEIVRQLMYSKPYRIILVDQAETPMYHIEQDLKIHPHYKEVDIELIIADVRDEKDIESVFRKEKIHFIFHAAAYKHVPAMEQNPIQAIKVNVLGTCLLADLAEKYQVETMVMVSTDKAVNPTNIMGASKRAAEMYVQSKNNQSQTAYITTRFGNVLDSNGSVIPLFKKQIAAGGPITVTHQDITRYFMTIPEACQLVLEAAFIGNGGEIFVFDMGESVKIVDLAQKMIRLSGLIPEKDIKIEYVGLRPGEKLYEELLNDTESVQKTHHDKIMISKVVPNNFNLIHDYVVELKKLVESQSSEIEIVRCLKKMVPEFLSQNSRFQQLDERVLN